MYTGKTRNKNPKSIRDISRNRLPPKFGKNYYDKNPEFYYKMDQKLRKITDTPENNWNLDGPSFVSYMPSVLNQTRSKKNFYDQKLNYDKSMSRSPKSDLGRRKYGKKGLTDDDFCQHPDYFNRARYERGDSPVFESTYTQSYHMRRPGYNMGDGQPPYQMKTPSRSPKNGSFSPNNTYDPKVNKFSPSDGRRKSGIVSSKLLNRKVQFEGSQLSGKNEKRTVRNHRKEPKLHPLQFCGFCDNYFHEKCFDDYYKNKKN
jgi:hypothetical protein